MKWQVAIKSSIILFFYNFKPRNCRKLIMNLKFPPPLFFTTLRPYWVNEVIKLYTDITTSKSSLILTSFISRNDWFACFVISWHRYRWQLTFNTRNQSSDRFKHLIGLDFALLSTLVLMNSRYDWWEWGFLIIIPFAVRKVFSIKIFSTLLMRFEA